MYKLYDIGLTYKMCSVINDCPMSSVVVNQYHSEFCRVLKGVGQKRYCLVYYIKCL